MAQDWSLRDEAPQRPSQLYYDRDRDQVVGTSTFPSAAWTYHGNQWGRQQLPIPGGVAGEVLLCGYDEQRHEGILVVWSNAYPPGYRTYRSVAGGWIRASTIGGPPTPDASTAYDPVAGRLLVFGGRDRATWSATSGTYAWDGNSWTLLPLTVTPTDRYGAAMAFDRARNRLVLFGGIDASDTPLGDTWEFDGVQWQQVASSGPSPRWGTMVYDATTQRVVLLGGIDPTLGNLADCWSWNGSQWQPRPNLPPGASSQGWGDAAGIHAIGGGSVWDSAAGGAWVLRSSDNAGLPEYRPALAFDPARGEVLAAGGIARGATWAWNGRWRQVAAPASGPGLRHASAMAPVGSGMVLFGGLLLSGATLADTWLWNGSQWTQAQPAHVPPARLDHRMIYDGQRALMFGGNGTAGALDDLWSFDGVDWTQLTTAVRPASRAFHGFAFDPVRQRAVLYGGQDLFSRLDDTWEWDGVQWTNVPTTVRPSSALDYLDNLVFDSNRGRVVACYPDGLWEWSGSDWSLTTSPNGADPTATAYVYDPIGSRLVSLSPSTYVLGAVTQRVAQTKTPCGNQPGLSVLGNVVPDHTARFYLESLPGVVAALALGFQPTSVIWGTGCEQGVVIAASVFGLGDAGGVWELPLAIPNDLSMRGVSLHAQAIALDGGPVSGASFSRAIRVVVGD